MSSRGHWPLPRDGATFRTVKYLLCSLLMASACVLDRSGAFSRGDAARLDGGVPFDGCVRLTECADLCGTVPDGCGATIDCGGCAEPNRCDPTSHLCVSCVPATCATAGAECGSIDDGCGSVVECGGCAPDRTCTLNRCTTEPCEPTTCERAGVECGTIPDLCDGTLECGGCIAPAVCSPEHRCACERTTCDALGASCGSPPDRCGGTLSCGECPSGSCSTTFVCDAPCATDVTEATFTLAYDLGSVDDEPDVADTFSFSLHDELDSDAFQFEVSDDPADGTEPVIRIRLDDIPATHDIHLRVTALCGLGFVRPTCRTGTPVERTRIDGCESDGPAGSPEEVELTAPCGGPLRVVIAVRRGGPWPSCGDYTLVRAVN
jgi:hypothetical protein